MPKADEFDGAGSVAWMTFAAGPGGKPGPGGIVARPGLVERLAASARVTVVSAPAGSGKTVLLRSWMGRADLVGRVGWVAAGRDERDPQRFWLSVLGALRETVPGAALVRGLTAAPDLDGWLVVERLLEDLAPLEGRLWLVVDDVHELEQAGALPQLELLVMRGSPWLRFVLATRHDLRLGLHRLRLAGELAEIRPAELRFSRAEAGELFKAAGVELSDAAAAMLHARTEGWVAGLRLAALSLAGHPDPERFAAEFSGSERTVAEYLMAEVLDRQSERVRRLLLRTSVLERVNGELADLLAGDEGGERVLQDLEQANAFVVSLDVARSWFRYHQLFADLLRLELRRTEPARMACLHRAAAGWLAGHGHLVEAIRQAQAGQDWGLAGRLLADSWPGLHLDGQHGLVHELLAGFPAAVRAADAELAAMAAADELGRGPADAAERYLDLARQGAALVPASRQGRARALLGVIALLLARQRVNPPAVASEVKRLLAMAQDADVALLGLGEDLRALALISLGTTEYWTAMFGEAERHLESGVTLAHRIGRPFLAFTGLALRAAVALTESYARAAECSMLVIELARRHGWTDEPSAVIAYTVLGGALAWQGRLEEAAPWVQRAERALRAQTEPAVGAGVYYVRGVLELGRGRDADALAALQAAEGLARRPAEPPYFLVQVRALRLLALMRLGQAARAGQDLAGLSERGSEAGEIRMVVAALRLAQDDPQAAVAALASVLDGSSLVLRRTWLVPALMLEAVARDALGEPGAAGSAMERALDLAEPEGALWFFLLCPAPGLVERHAKGRTSHAGLVAELQSLLAARKLTPPPAGAQPPRDPLSESELRVLRYLPTNLATPEIARELGISRNTIKTHVRNLYAKLGAHRRAEAVARARALGLLTPSAPH
jgi:LuxR family transcriptional regulator, maltose regulon positive regulatory protein